MRKHIHTAYKAVAQSQTVTRGLRRKRKSKIRIRKWAKQKPAEEK